MRNYCILLLTALTVNLSCSSGGDTSKELSGGYFFRDEGTELHDILNHSAGVKVIPANVLSYNFNDDFIIASQKPTKNPDPLYDSVPTYKDGNDSIYYWLIVNKSRAVIGPLSKREFEEMRRSYVVPETLQLKSVD